MNIDLRNCKVGDKLRIRLTGEIGESLKGKITDIVTYKGLNTVCGTDTTYPHLIEYSDGSDGTRTDDGYVYSKNRRDDDLDVIEVL